MYANVSEKASCSPSSPHVAQNQGDLDILQSCRTFTGSIQISSGAGGDLTINGIQQITGDLTANGSSLSSLSGDQLSSIGGHFQLSSLTNLNSLTFNNLNQVGTINFNALPELSQLGFGKGITQAQQVHITNTGLTSLDGIQLQEASAFSVTENQFLSRVNVTGFRNATGPISFVGNQDGLNIEFPDLQEAGNITARNVGEFAVPNLQQLHGLLGLYQNDFLNFSAPNLTQTADVSINNNTQMSAIDLSGLQRVNGGITLAGNNELRNVSLPNLEQVGGGVDFRGPLDG